MHCSDFIDDYKYSGLSHPFLGMGPRPMELGKLAVFFTKIGKFDIVLMHDVSIARLIPIIKLTLVHYKKREQKGEKKKQV